MSKKKNKTNINLNLIAVLIALLVLILTIYSLNQNNSINLLENELKISTNNLIKAEKRISELKTMSDSNHWIQKINEYNTFYEKQLELSKKEISSKKQIIDSLILEIGTLKQSSFKKGKLSKKDYLKIQYQLRKGYIDSILVSYFEKKDSLSKSIQNNLQKEIKLYKEIIENKDKIIKYYKSINSYRNNIKIAEKKMRIYLFLILILSVLFIVSIIKYRKKIDKNKE